MKSVYVYNMRGVLFSSMTLAKESLLFTFWNHDERPILLEETEDRATYSTPQGEVVIQRLQVLRQVEAMQL